MKVVIPVWLCLCILSCGHTQHEENTANSRLELVPEPDRDLREKYEMLHKKTDTIHADNVPDSDTRLAQIRETVRSIDAMQQWTRIETRELWETTEGGEAIYYWRDDNIEKIEERLYGETYRRVCAYYVRNGQCVFVDEKSYSYNRPITWDSVAMRENNDDQVFDTDKAEFVETQSYFDRDTLIRQTSNQDCGAPFARSYLQKERERVRDNYNKLVQLLEE